MKKVIVCGVMALLCVSLFAAGQKDKTYTIRVGTIVSETHPDVLALKEVFIPQIEQGSGGRIKVEIYPNGQLGGDREMAEAVQMGTLTMAIPDAAVLAGFDGRISVLGLPYLFSSRENAFAALNGPLGNKLNEYVAEKGFYNLGFQENGIRHVTNNVRPITQPSDLQGIKIRTMENPMHIAYFRAIGANPSPMAWGELYTALKQGTVDAQENPYVMIDDGKFYEVQKYVSETGHVFSLNLFIANKKFIDDLPADLREVVINAGKASAAAQIQKTAAMEADFKAVCLKSGMVANELSAEAKKAFIDATTAVYAQFEPELGKEIMDLARAAQK
jgi:tripartite ATP-independent transporter DctP family solute receptor